MKGQKEDWELDIPASGTRSPHAALGDDEVGAGGGRGGWLGRELRV